MSGAGTPGELRAREAEIGAETTRLLQLVPFEGVSGDWAALTRKHRDMLEILETAQRRRRELVPPAKAQAAWEGYLAAVDEQLVAERAVLAATETRSYDAYRAAVRALALVIPKRTAASAAAGLRQRSVRQRASLWIGLPRFILRAQRHARAERRAGRSWS